MFLLKSSRRKRLILFAFLVISNLLEAQSLDSLYTAYRQLPTKDTAFARQRKNLLLQLIDKETHQNPSTALDLIDTLANLHLETKDIDSYHRTIYMKGFLYASIENLPEALKYYQAFAKVFKKKGIEDGYFLIDVGNLYYDLRLFNMANRYYRDAEIIFDEEKCYRCLTTVYGNYALVAKNTNQLDTAFHYILKTLKIQEEFSRDTFQIAHTYQVLGRLYLENKKDFQSAIPQFQKSIYLLSDERLKNYHRYQQFIYLLPLNYMYLAKSLYGARAVDSAFVALNQSIEIAKEIQQDATLTIVTFGAGETFLAEKRYPQAESYLLEAEALSLKNKNYVILLKAYNELKNLYLARNQSEKALIYWDKYNSIKDSLQSQEDKFLVMNDQVLQQEHKSTIEVQQQQIHIESQLRDRLIIIIIIVTISLFIVGLLLWNLNKKNKIIASYTQELESNNAVKEMMLSVIGHDLRSLFNILMGNSGNLLKTIQQKQLTALEKDSVQLNTASKKAYMMMDGLMQWVTLQKKKTAPDFKKIRLIDIINATTEPLQPILWTSGVGLSVKVDDVFVQADSNLLQVILRNLLTNAIKYSPVNDTILIQSTIHQDQILTLTVSDNGSGIETEVLNKLFLPKEDLKIVTQGSGLGLKIVKELCDMLNIPIKAYNKASGGAVFELSLTIEGHVLINVNDMQSIDDVAIVANALTKEELEFLFPFVEQLKKLEIFEGTEIQIILDEMNQLSPSPATKKWIYDFTNAVYHSDTELYNTILDKVLNA